MSNLAVDELSSEERELATVVDGRFMDRQLSGDGAAGHSARPWTGWMRMCFFVFACAGSWSVVVLAIYLFFIF